MKQELQVLNEYFIRIWKSTIEYKVNLYMYVLNGFMSIFAFIVYGYFLTLEFVPDEFNLFMISLFLVFITFNISAIIWARTSLFTSIIRGDLNDYLKLPTNTFFNYYSDLQINAFLIILINIIGFSYFIFSIKLDFLVWVSIFISLIIVGFFAISISLFIDSLAWILKEFNTFFEFLFGSTSEIFLYYPFSFFQKFPYKVIFIISPTYFSLQFILSQIETNSVILSYEQLLLFIFSCILFYVSYELWQQGLKSYEAYG